MPTCSECGGTRFDYDDGANTTCINCGKILSSGRIVEEITFTGDGGSGVDGRLVGNEKVEVSSGAARIRELSELLALGSAITEGALRIYSLAKDNHFTNGRKIDHVAVSCLYAFCRRKETPHMLIDFSDAVNIKVQILGHTFLELCHYLNIAPPLIDPSLYLHRFASQLEFGSKTTDVTETALQFIQSMKRDWIQTGRRPSGISGAALLMAARFHGFMRTTYDIVHIVRVGDGTLRKRISEFLSTQAGTMTMSEFQSVDISEIGESETLPPCMIADEKSKEKALVKAEKKERKKQKRREKREKRKKEKQMKMESGEEGGKKERVKREGSSSSSSRSMSDEEESSEMSNYESMEGILSKLTGGKRKRKQGDDDMAGYAADEEAMGGELGEYEEVSTRKKKSSSSKKAKEKEKSKKKSKKEREREKEKKAMRKHKHTQKKLAKARLKRQQLAESGQSRHAFESTTSLNNIKHILDEQYGDEDILPVDQVNDEVMQVLHDYKDGDFARIVNNRTTNNNGNNNGFKLSQSMEPFLGGDIRFMDGVDLLGGGDDLGHSNSNQSLTRVKSSQPLAENNNSNNNNARVANKAPSQLAAPVANDAKEGAEKITTTQDRDKRGVDLTFDDIADEDVDCYVRSTRDNDAMRKIWHVVNRDFLTQKAQKEREAAIAEAQEKAKPTKRARRSKTGAKGEGAGEERRSSRLNYDALKILEGLEAHTRANDFDDLGEHGMDEEEGLPVIGEKDKAGAKSKNGSLSARDKQAEMKRLRNEDIVDYDNADEDDYYEDDEDAEIISFI